jgi:Tfp pilus assembly protein FimT
MSRERGQTLAEIVVTLAVISGLTSLLVIYNRRGEDITRVPRQAERLVFDLRKAQNYALSVREFAPGEIPCAYGINFVVGSNTYTIFADRDSNCFLANGIMDPGEEVEVITMEQGVIIQSANVSTVRFVAPSGNAEFVPWSALLGRITLALSNNPSFSRTVTVSRVGGISLQDINYTPPEMKDDKDDKGLDKSSEKDEKDEKSGDKIGEKSGEKGK